MEVTRVHGGSANKLRLRLPERIDFSFCVFGREAPQTSRFWDKMPSRGRDLANAMREAWPNADILVTGADGEEGTIVGLGFIRSEEVTEEHVAKLLELLSTFAGEQVMIAGEEPYEAPTMPEGWVDISGLSKPAVLAALFNAAKISPMGAAQAADGPRIMDEVGAQALIDSGHATPYTGQPLNFDYAHGRPIKTDLGDNWFDPAQYDSYNGGLGSAARAITSLREVQ